MSRGADNSTTQLTVRVPDAWVEELDALARKLSRPGVTATRTDALRAAVAAGIAEMKRKKGRGIKDQGSGA